MKMKMKMCQPVIQWLRTLLGSEGWVHRRPVGAHSVHLWEGMDGVGMQWGREGCLCDLRG